MSGEVLQSEVDSDPQTRPHVGWRAAHPPQLLLPGERVSELSVELLQLETQRQELTVNFFHCRNFVKNSGSPFPSGGRKDILHHEHYDEYQTELEAVCSSFTLLIGLLCLLPSSPKVDVTVWKFKNL